MGNGVECDVRERSQLRIRQVQKTMCLKHIGRQVFRGWTPAPGLHITGEDAAVDISTTLPFAQRQATTAKDFVIGVRHYDQKGHVSFSLLNGAAGPGTMSPCLPTPVPGDSEAGSWCVAEAFRNRLAMSRSDVGASL